MVWTLQNDPRRCVNATLLRWDINPQDRWVSSSSVVEHNGDSSPSKGRSSIHFTHEPGVLPPHISHLQKVYFFLPLLSSNISTLLLLFLRKAQMNWHIYKERPLSPQPAGFRLRNSHLEAPVLTPDWVNAQGLSREPRSGESTAMVGGACGCAATYPVGACASSVTD